MKRNHLVNRPTNGRGHLARPARLASLFALGSIGAAVACQEKPPAYPMVPPPPPSEAATQAPADLRYAALPQGVKVPEWAPPAATRFSLSNGIRVWHLEQGPTPLVSVQFVIPRGAATDPEGKEGLTALVADMLDEGAGKLSALELNEELGRLATAYEASAGVDYVLLGMNLLGENFESSIALLSDIVRRPRLPREEFDRRKQHFIAQAIAEASDASAVNRLSMDRALFGTGYAGGPADGTQHSLKSITYADLKKHHQALVAPDAVDIVVVGGIEQSRTKEALEAAFGDWKGKSSATKRPLSPPPERGAIYLVDYEGAAQSSLAIAKRAPGADAKDYFPAMIYSREIGEAFTSRINLNLREDKGYTYGARSDFRRYRDAGYFEVAANVKTDTTRASIDEIFRELADVCKDRPISDAQRIEAVSGLLLGYPAKFEHVEYVALRFATVPIYDRPVDFWQTWPQHVEAVTTEEANEAGRQNCDTSSYSIAIAGDKKTLLEGLQALDRPIIELDREGNRLP